MAKFTLWVPDELHQAVMEHLYDDANLSAILQEALRGKLRGVEGCRHDLVICTACSRSGTPGELLAAAQQRTQPAPAAQGST